MRIMARLRNYPNLEAKLRRLAQARGLIVVPNGASSISTHQMMSFDNLTSVKIMRAMSKIYVDETNMENIIYLKVEHD